jgi:hypothetical protein
MPVVQHVNNFITFVNGTTLEQNTCLLNRNALNINPVNFVRY